MALCFDYFDRTALLHLFEIPIAGLAVGPADIIELSAVG
jgi:hypothetical protein